MATKYQDKDIRWKWLEEKGYSVLGDKHQYAYMQSLWASTDVVQSVFVDAKAGTGKTTLAVAAGVYEIEKGTYDKIIYVRNAVAVRDQGFLPGSVTEKEYVYFAPLFDALLNLHHDGYSSWYENDDEHKKIVMTSTSYLRGVNFKNAFVIIDEAQNLDLNELQTVLTRIHDSCKVVVIGSTRQIDNVKKLGMIKGYSPFEVYMKHFEGHLSVQHKLITNYRGQFSNWSDEIQQTINLIEKT
ncbi:PhoH family protein [Bacillus sp. FJAT-22090]|uniref:PhoH family protein n=1 Tax=Bacillus sp. FJAT-22090 TaxID=1581038 RepID=UPI00164338B1|nr:PhoH family protein [Bacillus sp. FJAT-22090]